MRWPWSRTTSPTPTPFVVRQRTAYAATEEARLWCEAILEYPQQPRVESFVRALHREIGLAGLYASHHLRPERRRAILRLAHERSERRIGGAGRTVTLDPLGGLLDRALVQVRGALGIEGLCDELEEAHRHLLTARELLAAAPDASRHLTTHS